MTKRETANKNRVVYLYPWWNDKFARRLNRPCMATTMGGKAEADECGFATSSTGIAVAGGHGYATTDSGIAIAAYYTEHGVAAAGIGGTAISGELGISKASHDGMAISRYRGQSRAGRGGIVAAGEMGALSLEYHDGERCRFAIGYIGEDGLRPNVPYRLNDKHEFVVAEDIDIRKVIQDVVNVAYA